MPCNSSTRQRQPGKRNRPAEEAADDLSSSAATRASRSARGEAAWRPRKPKKPISIPLETQPLTTLWWQRRSVSVSWQARFIVGASVESLPVGCRILVIEVPARSSVPSFAQVLVNHLSERAVADCQSGDSPPEFFQSLQDLRIPRCSIILNRGRTFARCSVGRSISHASRHSSMTLSSDPGTECYGVAIDWFSLQAASTGRPFD